MSKLHRYRIPRWPHDARTAIFRWSPDFLTSDGDRQVPRQSPLDDLPIAVGASAEISVILKVNRAATEQSPGGGRQTSGDWLLRPGSRSKNPAIICRCLKTGIGGKSGDHRTILKACDAAMSLQRQEDHQLCTSSRDCIQPKLYNTFSAV